ncbi:DsbA family protein [Photobacterium leiognathi]|uniref:Protein-disulfide isomerase n=1 Tax=Photobacterium leiognathi subsp. mandapamensis TaxID=48408 RepID=A0A2T3KVI7_PHOLD|nr:DsbA family protein [Photobacterium leiognathi]PSV11118.1 protein-disulfide isomerase [Photobacterium leiognathi subsp. mandapamensis]
MKFKLIVSLMASLLFAPMSFAMTQQEQLQDINKILNAHPDIIAGLHNNLVMYLQQQEGLSLTLKENHDFIYANPDHPSYGAKQPKLTIAVITDLSCPWCKKLDPELRKLVSEYPDKIRIVNIYVPLKEKGNPVNSTTFALNVWQNNPDKFNSVEKMLYSKPGIHNLRSITKVAQKEEVIQDLKDVERAMAMSAKNYQLMLKLGVQGTPAMIIDDQLIPGYLPYDQLLQLVKERL